MGSFSPQFFLSPSLMKCINVKSKKSMVGKNLSLSILSRPTENKRVFAPNSDYYSNPCARAFIVAFYAHAFRQYLEMMRQCVTLLAAARKKVPFS